MENPNPKISETTSSEKVGWIDDLLTQILLNLPLLPLFRFKSVSKHWNSIISNPKFLFTHHQTHNRAAGLIFQNFYRTTRCAVSFDRSNPPAPQVHQIPDTLKLFHSCNGLFVLKHTSVKKRYHVYNPTTNQITTTLLKDDVINARPRDRVQGMFLAFDPSKSPHYKVVCVWELDRVVVSYEFDVYSSETGLWEKRGVYRGGNVCFYNGVYWNGSIHWLNLEGKSIYFNPDRDEVPRAMPPPPMQYQNYFGESCGHLHCVFIIRGPGPLRPGIHVYEMRRDYSEWFLKFFVDDQRNQKNKVRSLNCVVRGKRDEDSFLVLGNVEGEILRYNIVHNTCETMHGKATVNGKSFNFYSYKTILFQYIESPCSV